MPQHWTPSGRTQGLFIHSCGHHSVTRYFLKAHATPIMWLSVTGAKQAQLLPSHCISLQGRQALSKKHTKN